jgi:hypothetical protein
MSDTPRQPRPLRDSTGAIAGAFALASIEFRHEGTPAAIAEALGSRLREILPAEGYRVEVNGPVLDIKWGIASSWTGVLGMHLLEPGTEQEKLMRVFQSAAQGFRNVIVAAHNGARPQCQFEPHVSITDDAVHLWWGSPTVENAAVRLRPIPRSELGF